MPDREAERIRVLVVDDQKTMRKIVRQLLSQIGIENVIEAGNGEEALDILNSPGVPDPDVVICDLHMDKMDGTELLNHMRREEGLKERMIPVLILTGDGDDLIHEVTRQVGATKVLTKPISAPDLQREIEEAVGFTLDS